MPFLMQPNVGLVNLVDLNLEPCGGKARVLQLEQSEPPPFRKTQTRTFGFI